MNLQDIETFLENLALDVAEGVADPLEVYATIQSIRKVADPLEKSVKAEAIDKALEHNGEKEPFNYKGFTFTYRKGAKRYDYNHISAWKTAKESLSDIEALAKKGAEKNMEMVNPETGEVIEPAHMKFNADSLSVSR